MGRLVSRRWQSSVQVMVSVKPAKGQEACRQMHHLLYPIDGAFVLLVENRSARGAPVEASIQPAAEGSHFVVV